jgi:hypothetical protein
LSQSALVVLCFSAAHGSHFGGGGGHGLHVGLRAHGSPLLTPHGGGHGILRHLSPPFSLSAAQTTGMLAPKVRRFHAGRSNSRSETSWSTR